MKRRQFIKIIGSAIVARPLPARAQAASPPLVGVLSPISADTAKRNIQAFRSGLRALGYREGQNIRIELRFGDGAIERLPALAAELVRLKPAVIVAGSPPAALAVRDATHTIPIVMNSSENPRALGLASSLARPGGNVTGFWWGDEGLIGKQLELLKEAKPDTRSAGIIVDPDDRNSTEPLKLLPTVTRALDLTVKVIEVRSPADLDAAFMTAANFRLQALQVAVSPLFISYRAQITSLAASQRLPVIYGIREFPAGGGLMSYGTSLPQGRECGRAADRATNEI